MNNLFGSDGDLEGEARKMTSCEYVMEQFLLDQYFVYRYRRPLAFIVAAIAMPYLMRLVGMKGGNTTETYVALFVVYYVLEWAIANGIRLMLPHDVLYKLLVRCNGWQADSETKASCKAVIDAKKASQYLMEDGSTQEGFTERLEQRTREEAEPANSPEVKEEEDEPHPAEVEAFCSSCLYGEVTKEDFAPVL